MTKHKARALITGASSGIGRETALAFADRGIDVALVSRSADKLAAVAETAIKAGVEAKTYVLDLADVSKVEQDIHRIVLDG
ncbi:MAG: SDR family NAD(P)-dependent oxidoreductase, partial [Rivularia sp. (in: cyanobacteria)]